MGFIHGANRHEEILFPERLDDSIAEENPVRFIAAFVDHLTLTTLHAMNVRQLEMLEQQAKILDQQHTILEMLRGRQKG